MAHLEVSVSAHVEAPPAVVYGIFADYREKHPRVLPPAHFSGLVVEEGGVGAGTVVRFDTHALGQTRTMRVVVSEPEPGRRLMEHELPGGTVTTFLVEPAGAASQVTITTVWEKTGFGALVDRFVAVPVMQKVYAKEMRLLQEVAPAEAVRERLAVHASN